MTKAEILAQIKKAEEDAKTIISEAKELKIKKIEESKNKAREFIRNAETESVQSAEQKIVQAKERFASEKENMLHEGLANAESTKSSASNNIEKATKYLIEQFERTIHA